jgi:hypothetical protein
MRKSSNGYTITKRKQLKKLKRAKRNKKNLNILRAQKKYVKARDNEILRRDNYGQEEG